MKERMLVQDCSAAAASSGISCTYGNTSRALGNKKKCWTGNATHLNCRLEHTRVACCSRRDVCLMNARYGAAHAVSRLGSVREASTKHLPALYMGKNGVQILRSLNLLEQLQLLRSRRQAGFA